MTKGNKMARARAQRGRPAAAAALETVPSIGPSLAAALRRLGVHRVGDLRRRSPEALYRKMCALEGGPVDRCVLYSFRCAVYYANACRPRPDRLLWWNWKEN